MLGPCLCDSNRLFFCWELYCSKQGLLGHGASARGFRKLPGTLVAQPVVLLTWVQSHQDVFDVVGHLHGRSLCVLRLVQARLLDDLHNGAWVCLLSRRSEEMRAASISLHRVQALAALGPYFQNQHRNQERPRAQRSLQNFTGFLARPLCQSSMHSSALDLTCKSLTTFQRRPLVGCQAAHNRGLRLDQVGHQLTTRRLNPQNAKAQTDATHSQLHDSSNAFLVPKSRLYGHRQLIFRAIQA